MSPTTVTHLLNMVHARGNTTIEERRRMACHKRSADAPPKFNARRLGMSQHDALEMLRATHDWHTTAIIAKTIGKPAPVMHKGLEGLVERGLIEKCTRTLIIENNGGEPRQVAHYRAKEATP